MTTNRLQTSSIAAARPVDRRTLLTTSAALGLGGLAFPIADPPAHAAARQATPVSTEIAAPPAGAVYAMTNADGVGNAIVAFARSDQGLLTYIGTMPTGGEGTGRRTAQTQQIANGFDPLMSNHSLILAADRGVLFACNAGDGTVSSLRIGDDYALTPLATTAVGLTPTSLAYRDSRLFVALSGLAMDDEPTSLAGFQVGDDGGLTPIEGGTAVLSDAEMTKPTDLHFTIDGTGLLVLDTMTSMITYFPVAGDGSLGEAVVTPSLGMGPFGAAILGNGIMVVAETQGGPMNGPTRATLSSYAVGADGSLTPVSDQIPNMRTASCWVSVTPDGTQAISANTGDGTVSTYVVAADGSLTLAQSVAARQATTLAASSAPIDSAISADGAYYYQLWGGLGVITGYRIGSDGTLAPIDGANGPGLPQLGTQGIVAI